MFVICRHMYRFYRGEKIQESLQTFPLYRLCQKSCISLTLEVRINTKTNSIKLY